MKKYLPILRNSPFFKGLTDNEILSILHCVNATIISKERNSYIFRAGDSTEVMGLVLSGCVLVIQEDLWGHRNILSKCHTGDFFGEPYAASPGAVLNISVIADEDCEIIFLNVQRLLVSCPTACEHHQKLIRNLVSVLANKILILNDKITHVGNRTTRDKLLSYLSAESIRHSSLSFDIPFDRQQLADYLCIDRAAMSTEISKLQKETYVTENRESIQKLFYSARGGSIKMINKLHLAMIELYRGDAKRIQHFCKVHSYAKLIAETENVDKECLFIIEAAALTHDIGIHSCEEKYGNCNGKLQEKEGPAIAEKMLKELGFDQDVSDRVQYLIAHHHTYNNIDEIDYQILVEADFLVNIMEDGLSKEAALKAYESIFKTTCGKMICREMFDFCS